MYIGKRLKELRMAKGMSLTDLAQKSGVQIATLSRIEHLKMTGTLESHMKIAAALGADITQLYAGIIKEEDKVDLKTSRTPADVSRHSDQSSYRILTDNVLSKKMLPILLKVEPQGRTDKERGRAGTEKFVFMMEGKIEAEIAGRAYPLSRHHSMYFDAAQEHCFVNRGKTAARLLCVTTPPAL